MQPPPGFRRPPADHPVLSLPLSGPARLKGRPRAGGSPFELHTALPGGSAQAARTRCPGPGGSPAPETGAESGVRGRASPASGRRGSTTSGLSGRAWRDLDDAPQPRQRRLERVVKSLAVFPTLRPAPALEELPRSDSTAAHAVDEIASADRTSLRVGHGAGARSGDALTAGRTGALALERGQLCRRRCRSGRGPRARPLSRLCRPVPGVAAPPPAALGGPVQLAARPGSGCLERGIASVAIAAPC